MPELRAHTRSLVLTALAVMVYFWRRDDRQVLGGDQFAVLQTPGLYHPDLGLVWEDAEYLRLENSII